MHRIDAVVAEFFAQVTGYGILAVSGGADSMVMMRSMHLLQRPLLVAHINHCWRGNESDEDEAFVVSQCQALEMPIRTIRLSVDRTENAARRARYDWLTSLAKETAASWVATAHTLDDQAETVLHRLIRGSGIRGLSGMASHRLLSKSCEPVRPLLGVTRAEVLEYLTVHQQPYRIDPSNDDPAYTRNRIRHELLPLLKTFNPNITTTLARTAEQAAIALASLQADAQLLSQQVELPRTDRLIFDASLLATISDDRLQELFRYLWRREGWASADMNRAAWQRTVRVAKGIDSACDFPGGIRMKYLGRVVQLGRES